MSVPAAKLIMTPEEYLAWEAEQPEKHEYLAGEVYSVYAMTGARNAHVTVALNIATLLKTHLRGTPCRAYISDMKVEVEAASVYFYPDVFVTCDPRDLAADYVMHHPRVIIEVLSPSTAAFDLGEKFAIYRLIDSLREYVVVDPERRRLDVYHRADSGDWLLLAGSLPAGQWVLPSLEFSTPLEAVFEDVAPAS